MIDNGLYMIFDYYGNVDGQPLTCIIQVDEALHREKGSRIKLPDYLDIYKEITDIDEFQPNSFALKEFKMAEEDAKNTAIQSEQKQA